MTFWELNFIVAIAFIGLVIILIIDSTKTYKEKYNKMPEHKKNILGIIGTILRLLLLGFMPIANLLFVITTIFSYDEIKEKTLEVLEKNIILNGDNSNDKTD